MRMAAEGIPVYFFVDKYIKHREEKDLSGYLEQRTRYGASFYRVLKEKGSRMTEPSIPWVMKSVSERYLSWLKLAFALRRKAEYILLTPLTILFLSVYYWGFYAESRRTGPSADVVAAPVKEPDGAARNESGETSPNPE
jgi:hypothetical protein